MHAVVCHCVVGIVYPMYIEAEVFQSKVPVYANSSFGASFFVCAFMIRIIDTVLFSNIKLSKADKTNNLVFCLCFPRSIALRT